MKWTSIILITFFFSAPVWAVKYDCKVERKHAVGFPYKQKHIDKYQYSVRINESKDRTFLSRCSFVSSKGKITCDQYVVDKVVFDEHVKIKKYYVFRSQFDVQLFPNMKFIENNGRAGIAYGRCRVISQ